jgi:hypothetical protein
VLTNCDPGEATRLIHGWSSFDGGTEPSQEILVDDVVPRPAGRALPLTTVAGCGLAAHGRSAWTGRTEPAGVARVDFEPGPWSAPLAWFRPLPDPPVALAASEDAVWAVDSQADLVRRLDPAGGELIHAVKVGRDPAAVAVSGDGVWVANRGEDSLSRLDPQSTRSRRRSPSARSPSPSPPRQAPSGSQTVAEGRSRGSTRARTG